MQRINNPNKRRIASKKAMRKTAVVSAKSTPRTLTQPAVFLENYSCFLVGLS